VTAESPDVGVSESDVDIGARAGLGLLASMLRIRRFEERVARLKATGEILGSVHLYIGQEAVAVGVCSELEADDYVASTHRGHGHILAKGGTMAASMAELYGKDSGYCRGKGGSMHIADLSLGIIGANGVVGAGIPLAAGAALSAQMRKTRQVSVAFFGDGAANHGTFAETLNLASIWSLPLIFVCENNGYTELMPTETITAGSIAARASGYDMPSERVDGNDVTAVAGVARAAVARARAGDGPTLVEAVTYRIHDHSEGLDSIVKIPRSEEELAHWGTRDPIERLRLRLLDLGLHADDLARVDQDALAEVEQSVVDARNADAPDPSLAFTDVWLGDVTSAAAATGFLP
jgi:acetoin:2,6-dichlorophenolindophenol oxidoreductase subunit alpha